MGFFYINVMKPITVNILNIHTYFDKEENTLGDKLFRINGGTLNINDSFECPTREKESYRIILFYWLYMVLGLPFTLFSPKKTFSFFYKHTFNDIFDLNIFNLKIETKILTNFILYFISVYFLIKFIWANNKEDKKLYFPHLDYDWNSLYKSIKKNGFIPYRYKEEDNLSIKELIKINACVIRKNNIDTKHQYKSLNGNHRIYLLKQMYPEGKEIEVLFE